MSRFFIAVASALALASPAFADPIEDFYRGKQMTIYVRAAPGGNYDVYSRVLGRHIVRHLPGRPNVLTINMPGGGGLVALNHVANIAPRDGTALTMITQSFPMDQALGLDKNLKIDMRSLGWIGNMSNTNEFVYTPKASPTKTLDDARSRETTIAATGVGSIATQLTALYNNRLGTKFKIIYGYPSGPEMTLAMERGEVEARSTSNPQVLGASVAEVRGKYNFLVQAGLAKIRDYEDVPLLRDLAKDESERRIFEFLSRSAALARPVVTNPGVPRERLLALRRAFEATMSDPQFLAEAAQLNLEIDARSGEDLQQQVEGMLTAPADVLAQVAAAIEVRGARER